MSYASEVAADSPVAWYRMQEASGLIQDSSGNANHATSSAGIATYAQTGPITSEPSDKGIRFTGDDYFSIPDHATLDVGDTFSFECWIKRAAISSYQVLGCKNIGNAWGVYLHATTNVVRLYDVGVGSNIAESSVAITDTTTWHHIVVTKSGSTRKVYVDGSDVTSLGTNVTLTSGSGGALLIGSDASLFTNGTLDEVALYATALSAARVTAHYNAATAAVSYAKTGALTPRGFLSGTTPRAATTGTPVYWVKLGAAAAPFDATPTWTTITPYVRSMSWQRGRQSSFDEIGPGTGTLRLKNQDRRFEPGFAGSPYLPLKIYRPINIGCTWKSVDYSLFYGFAEEYRVVWEPDWGSKYSEVEVRLVDAIGLLNMCLGNNIGTNNTAVDRINALLTGGPVGFPSAMRDLSGGTAVQYQSSSTLAWAQLQEVARSHAGDQPIFVDRRGYVVFKPTVASGLTFVDGVTASGAGLKYTAAGEVLGHDLVYNRAEVTRTGGVMQIASDGTSFTQYRRRTHSRSTINQTDAAALTVAQYVISNYKEPKPRLEGFAVQPGTTSALWDAVVTLDLEHVITVKRTPPGGGATISAAPKIVGLSWNVDSLGVPQETRIGYTLAELTSLPDAGR